MEAIKPKTREDENYAVGVRTDGPVMIIQTYHNLEQLEAGYPDWREYAKQRKISKPIPLERVEGDSWKILKGLIQKFKE